MQRHFDHTLRLKFALVAAVAMGGLLANAQSIYIGDYNVEQVERYDIQTGADQGAFTSGYGFSFPVGLAFGPDGAVYTGDFDLGEIAKFDGSTGAYQSTFSNGYVSGQSIAAGPDGTIYEVDSYALGHFDENGNLIIDDPFRGHILGFDAQTGDLVSDYKGEVGGAFYDLRFGRDGNLYVTDNGKLQVYSFDGTTGEALGAFTSGGNLRDPFGLNFGPDGNLYVTSRENHEIQRFDGTTGEFIDVFASGDALNFPAWLIFGPDGNLYVADYGTNQISRFNGETGAYDLFASGVVGPMAFKPAAQDRPTAIRYNLYYGDCTEETGSDPVPFDFMIAGEIFETISSSGSCDCESPVQTYEYTSDDVLTRIGTDPACVAVGVKMSDENALIFIGMVSVEIDWSESGTHSYCLLNAPNGTGDCLESGYSQGGCDSRDYSYCDGGYIACDGAPIVFSNDLDGNGVADECDPHGACCFDLEGTCTSATSYACQQLGQNYLGDGTNCDPNLCPQPPLGACCFVSDQHCEFISQHACERRLGNYQGDDVACDQIQCSGDFCADAYFATGVSFDVDHRVTRQSCRTPQISLIIVDDVSFDWGATITGISWYAQENPIDFGGFIWDGTADIVVFNSDGPDGGPGSEFAPYANHPAQKQRFDAGDHLYDWQYLISDLDITLPAGRFWVGVRPVGESGNGSFPRSYMELGPKTNDGHYIRIEGSDWIHNSNLTAVFCLVGEAPCLGNVRGDVNCDGAVNFDDIDGFVAALIGLDEWCATVGEVSCDYMCVNDVNRDGNVDFADIDGFVECIVDGGCP